MKGYDSSFNSWIDKEDIRISEYFLKPTSLGEKLKVELDLSNYVTKEDLKNVTGVDTLKFAKKVDLRSLKSEVDKLDISKLENTLGDF